MTSAHIRRTAVGFIVVGAAVLGASCGGSNPAAAKGSGTLAVRLTDAPFLVDSVQSVDVFVVRVDGRAADADSVASASGAGDDSASAGGWTTLAKPNKSVNLLAFQNGASLPLGDTTLTAGSYAGFRIVIDPTRSALTLKNGTVLNGGSTPGVMFPSGSRSGIKIVLTQPIVVVAGDTTTMLIDFDVANSFVLRGNTIMQNGLLFKPVLRASVTP